MASTMPNLKLYRQLHDAYKAAYPDRQYREYDVKVSKLWNDLKTNDDFTNQVRRKIAEFNSRQEKAKEKYSKFWKSLPAKQPPNDGIIANEEKSANAGPSKTNEGAVSAVDQPTGKYETPKQKEMALLITSLSIDITHLERKKEHDIATQDELNRLCDLKRQVRDHQKKLIALRSNQLCAQKKRRKQKIAMEALIDENPDLAQKIHKRQKVGRPRLEEDQPELLKTILRIVDYGSSTHERRRDDTIHPVKTLKDLRNELLERGYNLSETALYLRLIPKRSSSSEGKRHVVTVPVKLTKASNDLHKRHVDTMFCKASINYLEELASLLGPKSVLFLSQDDKARVPIGKVAANKEAPLLMHVDYRVKLPDHDWVVAERHKLIPSVYALIEVRKDKPGDCSAVGYSGPTYIAIRSGKHSRSTARSHGKDFESLLSQEGFEEFCRTDTAEVKPVVVIVVDGGPDENPRYEKVQEVAISHFRKFKLDAIFIAANAPGRSAFNRVERRMAPLSRDLCGLILPHDHYGTHLDDAGTKTIDEDLERQNFRHAGETLAEIWKSTQIDGYDTFAAYIDSESDDYIPECVSAEWRIQHVREGHYFFQVVKCSNENCCTPMRSSLREILPQFMPAPLCFEQSPKLRLDDNLSEENNFCGLLLRLSLCDADFKQGEIGEVPFDVACPSIGELLNARVCEKCGLYHASLKSLKSHEKACSAGACAKTGQEMKPTSLLLSRRNHRPVRVAARRQRERMIVWTSRLNDQHADWVDDDDLIGTELEEVQDSDNPQSIPIISLDDYMESPWKS